MLRRALFVDLLRKDARGVEVGKDHVAIKGKQRFIESVEITGAA